VHQWCTSADLASTHAQYLCVITQNVSKQFQNSNSITCN
jgi:hypothetical protein